ncbi:MAG: hypothetical protein JSS50_00885 [Proteobacteria bacterium]|nr:hypothetical protein [Pseudomonadota bacterium]
MRKWIGMISAAAISVLLATAHAAEPKKLRTFAEWEVYLEDLGDGEHVCHAVAKPYRSKVFHGIRDNPFTAVTYQHGTYTFTAYPGFSMDQAIPPVVIVGEKKIPLKVVRDTQALTHSYVVDLSVFNHALANHGNFTVHSYSSHERSAIDVYSLEGLIKANNFMRDHCN